MGPNGNPNNPALHRQGIAAAEGQPTGNVGQVCETCPDNWVEAGAVDDSNGQPLPGIGYRIYDVASGDRVASGTLDDEGKSPRHDIPIPATQLYVVFGTEEAMDEAEEQIGERQREHALQANARPDWNGIPAGLDENSFNQAFNDKVLETGRMPARSPSLIGASLAGWKSIFDYVSSGFDGDATRREFYLDERAHSFDEYQLVTGAREASRWESVGGGAGQGISFGFGEEGMAKLDSLFMGRSYEEAVAARRQIMEAQRLANPGHFIGGEIAGAVPTIFVPVGGAAGRAVQAGKGVTGAVRAGATTGAATGALSGAGHDQGGVLDRLDGAAVGSLTGGMAGAVLSGAGVIIARGVAKTRIWGKISGRSRVDPKLMDELQEKGIKHTPEDVVRAERLPDGSIAFLEKGNSNAGLEHVMRHADDFARKGIYSEEVPDFIMRNLTDGNVIGHQGKGKGRPIYEIIWRGQKHHTAITTGSNGYIVGANPVSVK